MFFVGNYIRWGKKRSKKNHPLSMLVKISFPLIYTMWVTGLFSIFWVGTNGKLFWRLSLVILYLFQFLIFLFHFDLSHFSRRKIFLNDSPTSNIILWPSYCSSFKFCDILFYCKFNKEHFLSETIFTKMKFQPVIIRKKATFSIIEKKYRYLILSSSETK